MNWWDKRPQRLESEIAVMGRAFPQFMPGLAESDKIMQGHRIIAKGQRYWTGNLRTIAGNEYKIAIVYPTLYPGGEMRAYVIAPEIEQVKHMYGDRHLCLYSNDHGGKGQGHGSTNTAATITGWASAWLHAYEISRIKGAWPENNFFTRRRYNG